MIRGLCVLALAVATPVAWGQTPSYPAKLARIVGQQVLVESRPGSAAIIGTRYVKGFPADGYTLLTVSNTFARVPVLQRDAGYDFTVLVKQTGMKSE